MAKQKTNGAGIEADIITYEFNKDEFLEEIENKLGGFDRWVSIRTYRRSKQTGKWPYAWTFDSLPDEKQIFDTLGGGQFKMYIKWIDEEGNEQLRTKFVELEGDPKNPSAVIAGAGVKDDSLSEEERETKFLNKMLLMKNVFGGNNDNSVTVAAMENNTKILLGIMEASKQPPNTMMETIVMKLLTGTVDKNMESEVDRYVKYKKIFGDDSGGGKNSENLWLGVIDRALPLIPDLLKGNQQPAQIPPGQQAAAAPVPVDRIARIETSLQTMITTINAQATKSNELFGEVFSALKRMDLGHIQLELDYYEDDPEEYDELHGKGAYDKQKAALAEALKPSPEAVHEPIVNAPGVNGVSKNGSAAAEVFTSPELDPDQMRMAKVLRQLPTAAKVQQLKANIEQQRTIATKEKLPDPLKYAIDFVYTWCYDYKAVDSVEEFNTYLKQAGYPAYVPSVKK